MRKKGTTSRSHVIPVMVSLNPVTWRQLDKPSVNEAEGTSWVKEASKDNSQLQHGQFGSWTQIKGGYKIRGKEEGDGGRGEDPVSPAQWRDGLLKPPDAQPIPSISVEDI